VPSTSRSTKFEAKGRNATATGSSLLYSTVDECALPALTLANTDLLYHNKRRNSNESSSKNSTEIPVAGFFIPKQHHNECCANHSDTVATRIHTFAICYCKAFQLCSVKVVHVSMTDSLLLSIIALWWHCRLNVVCTLLYANQSNDGPSRLCLH